jgi:LuxR family quorum sensing-dependent transcriptional regulator
MATATWAKQALDFVDVIERLKTPRDVAAELQAIIEQLGFHAHLISGLPNPGNRIEPLVLANGWPSGWYELYTDRNFVADDPVVAHCHVSIDPFEWKDVAYDPVQDARAHEVMVRAQDFEMKHGFCVPIHSGDGFEAVVTMAGNRVDLTGQVKAGLHLMSMYAFNRCRSLFAHDRMPLKRPLTRSEREVLRWTAIGKTSNEISDILGIAVGTVNAHLASAGAKLNTRNRVSTAVAAVVRGEIRL